MNKPRIKRIYSEWFECWRWVYEPRFARENLCIWANNWCVAQNSKGKSNERR